VGGEKIGGKEAYLRSVDGEKRRRREVLEVVARSRLYRKFTLKVWRAIGKSIKKKKKKEVAALVRARMGKEKERGEGGRRFGLGGSGGPD